MEEGAVAVLGGRGGQVLFVAAVQLLGAQPAG